MENENDENKKLAGQNGIGPVIGSIIVIIVVIIGGVYFWMTKIIKDKQATETEKQVVSEFVDTNTNKSIDANELNILNEDLNNLDEKI